MSFRNQNRPPRSPSAKKDVGEVPVDKRRRIGAGRPGVTSATRKPLTSVNKKSDNAPTSESGSAEELDCAEIEFTKEEVEALIKQKPKLKKFDHKGNMEALNELMNKLRLCIKWSLRNEESHLEELGKLKSALEAAVKKYAEIEGMMKEKEEKSCATISELVKENTSLQEKLAKEEAEKLDAINCHKKEKEARVASEDRQASLSRDLEIARQDLVAVNKQVATLDDTYKRLQEYNLSLQQYNGKLHGDLETAHGSLQRVEKEKASIMETLSTLRGQLSLSRASEDEASKQKEALAKEVDHLRVELQQVRDDRDRQVSHVQALSIEVTQLKEFSGKSLVELDQLIEKSKTLEETCSSQKETINLLEHQLSAAKEKLKMTDLSATETRIECEEKRRVLHELQERLAEKEHQLIEGEKLRKKLHNTILELKGNIRVFCRVRPILPDDGAGTEMQVIAYPTSTEALGRGIDVIQNGQKYPFTFDKVFDDESSQHDVFVEISQLVQSALDGYKVCIFAYGQTGSGKTYTMMGRPEAPDQKGLIPRSLEQIFETSQSLKAQGWKFKMQASMLEIYNETIRDLLVPSRSSSESSGPAKQYNIKHDASGNTLVTDLTIVDVSSIQEISSLLRQAAQSRSVSKTLMNEQSSRSHFVFTLRISGINEGTEQQVQGVLNLIDLAGSERLSRSGATGDRLKETQAINKSLSCLSDVIFALARKDDHVPFRNSKLTYLLQPCLGGDSKTLMFVNISPDPVSVGESLCSLRFAARVNACEIGVPRRQMSLKAAESRLSYG